MCTAFSRLQKMNFARMRKEDVERVIEHGTKHLEFCMRLYKLQHEQGLYFLHEHPEKATSWTNPVVEEVMRLKGVRKVIGHMCAFGMVQEDELGEGLIKKPTAFMSNCEGVLKRLNKKCSNDHRHILLVGGRARRAQVYPDELCREILLGLMDQMRLDGRIEPGLLGMICPTEEGGEEAWDDVTGKRLSIDGVRKAREEEIFEFRKHGVYIKASIEECYKVTGKAPLKIRWIDINKGDEENEEHRSRLVAKEIKRDR